MNIGFLRTSLLIAFALGINTAPLIATAEDRGIDSAIGVTRSGTSIHCRIDQHTYLPSTQARIVLVGASRQAGELIRKTLSSVSVPVGVAISAVPNADPDDVHKGAILERGFPPPANAYRSESDVERQYLWRWLGAEAPDLVILVRCDEAQELLMEPAGDLPGNQPPPGQTAGSLAAELPVRKACGVDSIPVALIRTPNSDRLSAAVLRIAQQRLPTSPARREIENRADRTPIEIARSLSNYYGREFEQLTYIPALAMIARIRLGELEQETKARESLEKKLEPFLQDPAYQKVSNGSLMAGRLVFAELAKRGSNESIRSRAQAALSLAVKPGLLPDGAPAEAMPFHHEMSDAIFMAGPVLSEAARLSNDPRYAKACLNHVNFIRGKLLRADGLYRHSPLDESAWGRGNGFPALGLAWCLTTLSQEDPSHEMLLEYYQQHMEALVRQQDASGMWRQLIDRPESYRELTSTCMITFAMARGVRRGWLNEKNYESAIQRAWRAISERVGNEGDLIDVCTGTGKQKSRRDYYDRTAILGRDDRGGAMAMLAALEVALWERTR